MRTALNGTQTLRNRQWGGFDYLAILPMHPQLVFWPFGRNG